MHKIRKEIKSIHWPKPIDVLKQSLYIIGVTTAAAILIGGFDALVQFVIYSFM